MVPLAFAATPCRVLVSWDAFVVPYPFARAAVVFVDYDRSPEAQYPAPIEQAYAATRYVVDHAARLNLDASRLAVAGDSGDSNSHASRLRDASPDEDVRFGRAQG